VDPDDLGPLECRHAPPVLSPMILALILAASLPPLQEARLVLCEGLPCIPARLSGKPATLLFDTGNTNSLLDKDVARSLGVEPMAVQPPDLPPGMYLGEAQFAAGGIAIDKVQFLVVDLAPYIAEHHIPRVAGTISYGAFRDRVLQLDLRALKLRLSAPLEEKLDCQGQCATWEPLTFGRKGPPQIVAQGFEIDGKPLTAQIDTMFAGTLLIYDASIEKLGLSAAAQTQRTKFFPFTDFGVPMREAQSKDEGFLGTKRKGPVYFATEKVHQPDGLFDATAGVELLKNCVLTIDLHDRWVRCQH
jgi:Aspartyl protease